MNALLRMQSEVAPGAVDHFLRAREDDAGHGSVPAPGGGVPAPGASVRVPSLRRRQGSQGTSEASAAADRKPAVGDGQGIKEEDNVRNIDTMDEDKLAAKLKETLKNKRYLIVIDDVWSEAAWDAIQCVLPDNNCGSRIIVTTRIDTVARACSHGSDCIYHIKALGAEDSKKLFLSRVFGSTNGACPREIEDVMQKILRKCGGLPLAIVSIASLLASYKSPESRHMWEVVLKSIGSHMESHPTLEGMRQIVVLSYDHLPHHLKACMMYLSIFPEDFVIVKERLLRRWIAEGLVAEQQGLALMEVAEGYFSELVSRSMIDRAADIVTYYDGREETCRVHDMMLEVMVTKSLEANFVSLIGGQYEGMSYDRVRRLSIHAGEGPSSTSMSSKKTAAGMNVQHVRSLSMFEFEGHHLLSRLGEFTLLRLLRFLNLRGTDISVLPPEVGQLEHLQTLDVRLTFLKGLPETVTELENLESLQFSNKDDYWSFHWEAPRGLRKMKALRKVNNVVVTSNTEVAKEIAELGQLQELTIFVPSGIPRDVAEVLDHSLSRLYSLRFLNVEIISNREEENFLHRLESRSPPRLLRYPRMCGSLGDRTLTHWVGLLTNLVEFVIAWAYLRGDTLFDVLCKLPNLKKPTLERDFYADTEIVARTTQSFPVLTELRMFNNHGIPAVYRFEEGSMPKLETLAIKFYVGQQSIVGIEHLTNLKEVQFTGEKDNRGIVEDELKKLKEENARHKRNGSNQLIVKVRYE
ncbi:Disease resistance protein RPM1 [Panicum miliaceum]|uniref:Disease resistance protein RPM1 n=1 Tax=Panicum miliaceum TaxID=4540 RepID=A0A3L6RKW1_PANMI|nr:Disease resistance protein RPM1 [Panicum miliaceum]